MSEGLPVEIRFVTRGEWEDAMGLAWKTFLQFEGDVYPPEGVRSFRDFITDSALKRMFTAGAYQVMAGFYQGRMVGMISLRNESHISLLFVDSAYHHRGIGRALILALEDYVRSEIGKNRLTVNASPYGVGFYHRLGFQDIEPEKQQDGIIFTPMFLNIEGESAYKERTNGKNI
jgi:GNAT superfamily N-acetyltransferase